jgi:CheY-specific phosphatase CheX
MEAKSIMALRKAALDMYDLAQSELKMADPNTQDYMLTVMEWATVIVGIVGRLAEDDLDSRN